MGSSGLGRPRGAERIWSNFGSTVLFNNPYHDSTIAAIRDHRTGFRLPHVARRTPLTSLIYAVTFDGDVARRPEEGRHTTRRVPKRTGMQCTSSRTRGEPEYPTAAGAAGAACWVLALHSAPLGLARSRRPLGLDVASRGASPRNAVPRPALVGDATSCGGSRVRVFRRVGCSNGRCSRLAFGVFSASLAFDSRLLALRASEFRASAEMRL